MDSAMVHVSGMVCTQYPCKEVYGVNTGESTAGFALGHRRADGINDDRRAIHAEALVQHQKLTIKSTPYMRAV